MQAFRQLVDCNYSYAFSIAIKILCSEDDAKDAVQECFIKVWKNIYLYNGEAKFTTWMFRILSNICFDKLKANKRRNKVLKNDLEKLGKGIHDNYSNIETALMNKELADKIESISRQLKPKQRIVFVLRDLQELSISEVSNILGMSESSVKANLVYARRNIRGMLEKVYKYEK